ncbi:tRNA preQ1(34) S-adenosylmethionine ribosyltransferase-isomerase QueA [Spirochaeta isovalerica]|uniref:S-adenosylmethionine:tRNA ribosyltransferase-isomerase n=1 Tax=Spirochaeta isovalerica TaxID=150 RepID=A0A841R7W1_9SPIO|nr:tRNA preQ1(34) S-adenosylmethionine ribosyltransferase-isomerase QueA [Spirochaeta isovalerica]MBB6478828.1 S-adenosylmethionine:tRNA ribosyltransferase-isomerase [Spirochaeta isovalerica]
MKIRDFSFDLPDELIAQYPPEERGTSNLMVLDPRTGTVSHKNMQDFPDLIDENTLVVFNNSKVRKARLFGFSEETGGKVEFFLLEKISGKAWKAMVSKAKRQKVGKKYNFPGSLNGRITEEGGTNIRTVEFDRDIDDDYLDEFAHIPLPPYIKREDELMDSSRYQSVFSEITGSVAAPTASLHFTEGLIHRIKATGADVAYVTLHVGLGTFAPVRTENLLDHEMHKEEFYVSDETAEKVESAVKKGKKILAVGTTSIRTLESAWQNGELKRGTQYTDLFIYPGYKFKIVNQIFTNFHTPESTLLVLVSAFAGKEFIERAYKEAVEKKYRFFSYGDAMFIKENR